MWLEVRPRFKHDAAHFTRAEMMLDGPDMRLAALQVHAPNGSRTVYRFDELVVNKPIDGTVFRPALPAGWAKVVEDTFVGQSVAAQQPASAGRQDTPQ